jgi:4-amino-4-deoxy-L-arabinose transferase-like glycosyltransferase
MKTRRFDRASDVRYQDGDRHRQVRMVSGTGLLLLGLASMINIGWWPFDFLEISTDHVVEPRTWLLLRVAMISFAAPGLIILFWPFWLKRLHSAQRFICDLPPRVFATGVIGIAAVLRIVAAGARSPQLVLDYRTYHELARTWAHTGEYAAGAFPTAYFPPGWPFFLSRLYAVFGENPIFGVAANVVLGTATVYLAYRLVARIWGEVPGRWTAVIITFFPSQIMFVNFLCSEILFTFLFLGALNIVLMKPLHRLPNSVRYLAAGLTIGAAALVRSLLLMFPVVMLPYLNRIAPSRRKLVVYWFSIVIGVMIVVAPWMIRNGQRVGRAIISTNGGVNLYIGNNPLAGGGFTPPDSSLIIMAPGNREAYYDRLGYQLAGDYIIQYPFVFFKRGFLKVAHLLATDTEGLFREMRTAAQTGNTLPILPAAVFSQSYYMICLLFALAGIMVSLCRFRLRRPGGYLLIFTMVYWLAIHFVVFGDARFHYPIIPILAGFAAVAITESAAACSVIKRKTHGDYATETLQQRGAPL